MSSDRDPPMEPEDRTSHLDAGPIPDENEVRLVQQVPGEDVTDDLLAEDGQRADSWLHYKGSQRQVGFSPADRLTPDTVDSLERQYTIDSVPGIGNCAGQALEVAPLIVPGDPPVMYITQGNMNVNALNARTGEGFWKFVYGIEGFDKPGVRNRGAAIWRDRVFYAVPDESPLTPRVLAVDRYNGELLWESTLMTEQQAENDLGERLYVTEAPLVYDGKVYIAQASDRGGWCNMFAFDAETGEQVWAKRNCPQTQWVGDSWRFSSGAAWMTPSVDPESDTVFFTPTNPDPMMNGIVRPGPNKHTESIVALDANSGELKWSNQLLAHELWDYDVSTTPMVYDMEVDGETRRVISERSKAGWVHVVDAETGQLLERSRPFARQDHTAFGESQFLNLPPAGRENLAMSWPGLSGATEWPPESYNRQTGLIYTGGDNHANMIAYDPNWSYDEDEPPSGYLLGGFYDIPSGDDLEFYSEVNAIDPASGEIRWSHEIEGTRTGPSDWRFTGGTTSTAGNLVFHGTGHGKLIALNAESGEKVWETDVGERITAQPVIWDDPADQRQYVAISALQKIVVYAGDGGGS